MKQQVINGLKVIVIGLVLSAGISYAGNWVAPAGPPPGNNAQGPINVGTTDQVKDGGLAVNHFLAFDNGVFTKDLYVKDLFIRESNNEWEQLRINHICSQINQAYEYQVGDLNDVLSAIRKQGFIVNFIRPPQVDTGLFEHLTISNDFQNLFNIGKIDSWEDYVFPIDFFEILVEKPLHNIEEQKHLYFMNR